METPWPRASPPCAVSPARGTAQAVRVGRSSAGHGVFCRDNTGLGGESGTAAARAASSQRRLLTGSWRAGQRTSHIFHLALHFSLVTPRVSAGESRGAASARLVNPNRLWYLWTTKCKTGQRARESRNSFLFGGTEFQLPSGNRAKLFLLHRVLSLASSWSVQVYNCR